MFIFETAKKKGKKNTEGLILRDNEFYFVSSAKGFVDAVVEEHEKDVAVL